MIDYFAIDAVSILDPLRLHWPQRNKKKHVRLVVLLNLPDTLPISDL
jgi:hypothetical protein